jgi:hypothetical protein
LTIHVFTAEPQRAQRFAERGRWLKELNKLKRLEQVSFDIHYSLFNILLFLPPDVSRLTSDDSRFTIDDSRFHRRAAEGTAFRRERAMVKRVKQVKEVRTGIPRYSLFLVQYSSVPPASRLTPDDSRLTSTTFSQIKKLNPYRFSYKKVTYYT